MQSKLRYSPLLLFQLATLILMAVLPFSRALISISTGIIFISAILEFFSQKKPIDFKNVYFICLALLVLFCVLDGLRVYSVNDWVKGIEIKLPLLLLPFGYLVFRLHISYPFKILLATIFTASISVATLASIYNYIANYKEINQLVLQSRHVPIIGGMHHITFSVYCAVAVLISALIAYKTGKKWFWVPATINFIGLHVLTARTGLAGFYFSLLVASFVYFLRNKPKPQFIVGGVLAAVIIPVIAFFTVGSFHNRVLNTWDDLRVMMQQKDANYQSMGMRVEATKTAFYIIKKNPFIGVGFSNITHAMAAQYEENNSNLFLENRILPHMQLVMEAAVHGILGLMVMLLFFIWPILNGLSKQTTMFVFLWSLILFACLFECLFDRQHGILLIGFFWFLFHDFEPKRSELNSV